MRSHFSRVKRVADRKSIEHAQNKYDCSCGVISFSICPFPHGVWVVCCGFLPFVIVVIVATLLLVAPGGATDDGPCSCVAERRVISQMLKAKAEEHSRVEAYVKAETGSGSLAASPPVSTLALSPSAIQRLLGAPMGPKGKEQLGEANGHKGNGQGAQGSLSASLNSVRALSRACQSLHRAMGAKEAPSTALRAKGRVITRKLRARSKKGVHASKAPPPSRKCRAFDFKGSNRGWNAMATCEAIDERRWYCHW